MDHSMMKIVLGNRKECSWIHRFKA